MNIDAQHNNGQHNLTLFAIAIVNIAAIICCLMVHVPASRAGQTIAALVTTLLIAFVSFDSREAKYCTDINASCTVPLPEDVTKRIYHFGLTESIHI